ncbi:MAG: hypothetical protein R2941_14015 [Desulfobacterales bacterium]
MGFSWNAFIVPASDEEAFGRVKKFDPDALMMPGGFARIKRSSGADWTQPGSSTAYALEFGEAWFLYAKSSRAVFAYEHSKSGEILRFLSYSGERGWITVQGFPEEWESILFDQSQIALGENMVLEEPDEKRWSAELASLKEKKIVAGHLLPAPDPAVARFIAQRMGTRLI